MSEMPPTEDTALGTTLSAQTDDANDANDTLTIEQPAREDAGSTEPVSSANVDSMFEEKESSVETDKIETVEVQQLVEEEEPIAEDSAAVPVPALSETQEPGAAGTITGPGSVLIQKKHHSLSHRWPSVILIAVLLIGVVTPLVFATIAGASAYSTYTSLRSHANNGVKHLLSVKNTFTGAGSHPTGALSTTKLAKAKNEFLAARTDFTQMQFLIDHTALIQTITQYLPQYRPQVTTARAASQIGIDIADMGSELIDSATILAPRLNGPLLSNANTPLLTPSDLNVIRGTINTILPLLNDIQTQTPLLSLDALPSSIISPHQRVQVMQVIELLPTIETALVQGRDMLDAFGWLLGVDSPRTFLVQTMDRSELRPTGGFTGQYGELQINGGRVGNFSLRDISLVEYADNSPTSGRQAPASYRSWWPFANWGLRDSNLSADFPTSAKIATQQYEAEVKHHVDGVILFTPFLIEHILQILGPLQIPEYQETITAQNLEQKLHYYQLDNAGIAKQQQIQGGDTSTSDRKRFTSLVAHLLMDRVRHASPTELLAIARELPHDLQTKDLQIFMTNQQLQDKLVLYGYAGELDRSTTHDGLYVVQANVSASKASQYVRTSLHDVVTLDASGGATHVMQMQLAYTQLGPVYGLDTYRDYVRIYVPPSAKLLWGDGFDTGKALCITCDPNGVYPHSELVCPTGLYHAGASAPMIGDPYVGQWHPIDTIGPPTNLSSDEPGRAMFGGYVVVPKNCTMLVTLSWYVPPMGYGTYNLLVQRQAGTFPNLDLTVLPTPGNCTQLATSGQHFTGVLTQDASFSLARSYKPGDANACYPQPGV